MTRTTRHRVPRTALAASLALALVMTGCTVDDPVQQDTADETTEQRDDGHGEVAGAEEVAEPQSQLISISADGEVGLLDLLTEETTDLGSIGTPEALDSDGRYAFVTTSEGVEVIDGGRWTWDHGDHFHYYRADPTVVGTVPGTGPIEVTTSPLATDGGTGLFFAGTGEAVLLDNEALSNGVIAEVFRMDTDATSGVVAPVASGAVVAVEGESEATFYDADGTASATAPCAEPSGAITTRAGTVVGCADGALLATVSNGELAIEEIPYPPDGERALAFEGRKNRPTVSALSGDSAFWLLSTRNAEWTRVDVDETLVRAVAADDADRHVVALDDTGRIRVYSPEGVGLAVTEPLVGDALADGRAVALVVDQQRAYVSDPAGGVVYEIDYADDARVARELSTPTTPDFATELGR